MTTRQPLLLAEEILLLALDDTKGTTAAGSMFVNAMGGAILSELVMMGAVQVAEDKKKTTTAVSGASVADPLHAEALQLIITAKKAKGAAHWVQKFAALKDLRNRTARGLVSRGVLHEETGTVLKIFKRTIFPEADGGPERELMARLEAAIFADSPTVAQRTVVIIALARAAGMLEGAFDKKRLKGRKDRLEKLTSGELVGEATAEVIAAIRTAVMVATMVPVITATAASSH